MIRTENQQRSRQETILLQINRTALKAILVLRSLAVGDGCKRKQLRHKQEAYYNYLPLRELGRIIVKERIFKEEDHVSDNES